MTSPGRLLLLLVVAAAVVLAACDDEALGELPGDRLRVEIGVVQSLSGAGSAYGRSALRGIELAVQEVNASDAGVEMSLTLVDDGSNPEAARAGFQTLVRQGVTAIIGPTLSAVANDALAVAQEAGVPVLAATTTGVDITEVGDYIFRVALPEAAVVPVTIARVHEDEPIELAALIYDGEDAFSLSSAEAMREGIEAIGATVLVEVDLAETTIQSALSELRGRGLDAMLITPLADTSAEVVRTLRDARFEQVFIGGNSFNTLGITEAAGGAIEGAYVGAAWNPALENDVSRRFVSAYAAEYGEAPELFAAQGYSAVYLLLDAVQRAESVERGALKDALAGTAGVAVPLGIVSMSQTREAIYQPVVQRFEGGELLILP